MKTKYELNGKKVKEGEHKIVVSFPKNVFRTAEYIKLLHCINSCTNVIQLNTIKETILKYFADKKTDAPELLAEYYLKQTELSGEKVDTKVEPYIEDEILNMQHNRLEAK